MTLNEVILAHANEKSPKQEQQLLAAVFGHPPVSLDVFFFLIIILFTRWGAKCQVAIQQKSPMTTTSL